MSSKQSSSYTGQWWPSKPSRDSRTKAICCGTYQPVLCLLRYHCRAHTRPWSSYHPTCWPWSYLCRHCICTSVWSCHWTPSNLARFSDHAPHGTLCTPLLRCLSWSGARSGERSSHCAVISFSYAALLELFGCLVLSLVRSPVFNSSWSLCFLSLYQSIVSRLIG